MSHTSQGGYFYVICMGFSVMILSVSKASGSTQFKSRVNTDCQRTLQAHHIRLFHSFLFFFFFFQTKKEQNKTTARLLIDTNQKVRYTEYRALFFFFFLLKLFPQL